MKVPRSAPIAALTMMLVMLLVSFQPLAKPSVIGETDWGVIDPYLQEMLGRSNSTDRLQIIVQFLGHVEPADRDMLRSEGVVLKHEFHIVPGFWAIATPGQIERVAGYPRTFWIEYNERLQYMMQNTTTVINATRAWNSIIEGGLLGDNGIDGKGVTVCLVDSGIDAGHPDLDYGTKVLKNLKSDTGVGPWVEVENSDTSSGHGTHCAGTIAGNGDASAGQRRGVAPGANLIGLSTGELIMITNPLGGLEWVYDNSRPGNNPYNIRVVSNSWGGGGGQYNPQDSISQAINKLTYENDVVVTFAAGNSAGTGDDIQSSNYGNTPAAICVAASDHEGKGITDFSSKGQWDWVDTWPDIAAPGLDIWSTAARRTLISTEMRSKSDNPYYFAISGTSMATPHISGLVALLWQAAPSLRVSDVRQDVGVVTASDGVYTVGAPTDEDKYGNLAYSYSDWTNAAPDTRIHEAELILKLTADYIQPQGSPQAGQNNQTQNYIPDWSVPGFAADHKHDFSQGYGLVNAQRAVGLALALQRLRENGHPEATVLDAYSVYMGIFEKKDISAATDTLTTNWRGEWSRFNMQDQGTGRIMPVTANQTKLVYIPEGASNMTVTLSYNSVSTSDLQVTNLQFLIDLNGDGQWDYTSTAMPRFSGTRTENVKLSGNLDRYVMFGIQGRAVKVQTIIKEHQFEEARAEYKMSVYIQFPSGKGDIVVPEQDPHAIVAHLKLGPPSQAYSGGNISLFSDVYNLSRVVWNPRAPPAPSPKANPHLLMWLLIALIAALVAAIVVGRTMPESKAGRVVRGTARALGVPGAIGAVRKGVDRISGKVSRKASGKASRKAGS